MSNLEYSYRFATLLDVDVIMKGILEILFSKNLVLYIVGIIN